MTPKKSSDIFTAYSSLIPIATDYVSLEAISKQIIEDNRLTQNQMDALMALAEAREMILLGGVRP